MPQGSSGGRQAAPRPTRSGGWQGGGLEGGGVRLPGWGKAPAGLTSRQGRKVGAKQRARAPACAPRNPEAHRPACHREGGGLPPPAARQLLILQTFRADFRVLKHNLCV